MTDVRCALYARVSSESQARDNTIASQVIALRERIVADGFLLSRVRVTRMRATAVRFCLVRRWSG